MYVTLKCQINYKDSVTVELGKHNTRAVGPNKDVCRQINRHIVSCGKKEGEREIYIDTNKLADRGSNRKLRKVTDF